MDRAADSPPPAPDRHLAIARLARYAATSVVAFAVSEVTLLLLYGHHVTGAAVAANLVAIIPSYLMSRYWIWSEAPRGRAGRQVVMYWITSIVCIAGTSLSTGAIAGLVPTGQRFHLAVVGVGFFLVNIVFWLAKFVVYQRVIFPVDQAVVNTTGASGDLSPTAGRARPWSAPDQASVWSKADSTGS